MPYEFVCSKCPSSLWAHDNSLKKLEALVVFHYDQHGYKLTPDQARNKIRVLYRLKPGKTLTHNQARKKVSGFSRSKRFEKPQTA